MATKAERRAAKKQQQQAEAQRVTDNPAEAILGTPPPEGEQSPEEIVDQRSEESEEPQETGERPEASEEEPQGETEPKAEVTSLEDIVTKAGDISSEIKAALLEQLGKLRNQAEKNEANKRYAEFDKAIQNTETGVAQFIAGIAKTCGVDLSERKLTVSYPKGEFSYTNSAIGKKGDSTSRNGFPSSWGDAKEIGLDGKEIQSQSSPSKLAEHMGLQVEGKRNMTDVFENPTTRGSKNEISNRYKVEAVRGEYFRVIHIKVS